jgi:hypothetical protein
VAAWLLLAGDDKSRIGGTRNSQGWKTIKLSVSKAQGKPKRDCDALAKQLKGWDGKNHTCQDDLVNSRFDEDQDKLWTRSGAPVMWCKLMERLETEYRRGKNFFAQYQDSNTGQPIGNTTPTREIARMLGERSPKDWTCGMNPDSKCAGDGPICEDIYLETWQNRAAASLILNSLINLSKVTGMSDKCFRRLTAYQWYKMLKDAYEYTYNHIGPLANMLRMDFAPTHKDEERENTKVIKFIADIAQVAVFLPNAAVWYRVRRAQKPSQQVRLLMLTAFIPPYSGRARNLKGGAWKSAKGSH